MQLIDVTNSYARKIRRELMNTPVHFIKVFTLGNSKVVFKKKKACIKTVNRGFLQLLDPYGDQARFTKTHFDFREEMTMKNLKAKLMVAFMVGAMVVCQLISVAEASWYRFR